MNKQKPVVKYQTRKFRLAGKHYTNRSKLTLLTTVQGALAKKIAAVSDRGELYWLYFDTKGKEKLEIYQEKLLWSRPTVKP